MLKMQRRIWIDSVLAVFSFVVLCSPVGSAPSQREGASQSTAVLTGNKLTPEDPTKAILAAFDRYEVVGMDAAHGNKDLDDLILHLVRDPRFPNKVNDVVVECGNSLYQGILDRYIAGGTVPLTEVRKVWRDTSVSMCSVSTFYETLFPLLRRINQRLPAETRIRVLGGDPPLDWAKVTQHSEATMDRDASIASVMEKEVLSKKRKALMLFGAMHLYHTNNYAPRGLESAVQQYERSYPRATFVIGMMIVSKNPISPETIEEMNRRMASWPSPSLVQNLKGSWLSEVDPYYFTNMADAYLYLGPADLILAEPRLAEIFLDKEYMSELRRRAEIIKDRFLTGQTDAGQISDDDFDPFLYPSTFQ
jgi:hypothetical protein